MAANMPDQFNSLAIGQTHVGQAEAEGVRRQKLLGIGASPIGSTPEEFARYRKAEFAKVTQLASKAGLRTDK